MAGTVVTSVVKNDTTTPPAFQNSSGTEVGQLCRAWVNFDGSTGARRASFNVSSITVNGACDYTVNFTNALADSNYAAVVCMANNANSYFTPVILSSSGYSTPLLMSTTQVRIGSYSSGNIQLMTLAVFR